MKDDKSEYDKILSRLRSLEEFLGLAFSPKDSKDDYEEHLMKDYSMLKSIEKKRGKWRTL